MFARLGQGQIIDVTKECTFDWGQEPASCCAFLEVSGASGDFTDGETVTGGTSNATATVFSSYVGGGRVYVENVSGTFQAGETITGGSSGKTATVDGFVAERSYTSTPNNITHGTFPDSIISLDEDDYLEWESTASGANFISKLSISPPSDGIYLFTWLLGVGEQIDSSVTQRDFNWRCESYLSPTARTAYAKDFCLDEGYVANVQCPFIFFKANQFLSLEFYQNNKGTFRWRIHNIRVLKLVI